MAHETSPIRILITGGTIDKEYDPLKGELVFTTSHIEEMLQRSRFTPEYVLEEIMLKDSLDMTDSDRALINQVVTSSPEERLIITHGTDTMVDTARVLTTSQKSKTIVLAGAMVPYSVGNSDALFNLGFALAAVQVLPHGVYVAMSGRIFDGDMVRKNKSLGIFQGT